MNTSLEIAKKLLEIEAVKVNFSNPFTWTSGLRSPIYCDNRKTLSYPAIRTLIMDAYIDAIKTHFSTVEVIAGVATAGIAQGAIIAQTMQLPYCYVRPEPKKHGMKNQIEGYLIPQSKTILIEDLISTGMSSLKAVEAVKEENSEVLGVLSIFNYDFDIAKNAFEEADCKFYSLCNLDDLIKAAIEMNYMKSEDIQSLEAWRADAALWSSNFIAMSQQ